jgi:hypothetical protein
MVAFGCDHHSEKYLDYHQQTVAIDTPLLFYLGLRVSLCNTLFHIMNLLLKDMLILALRDTITEVVNV